MHSEANLASTACRIASRAALDSRCERPQRMSVHLRPYEPFVASKGAAADARGDHHMHSASLCNREQLGFEPHSPRCTGHMKRDWRSHALWDIGARKHMIVEKLNYIEERQSSGGSHLQTL